MHRGGADLAYQVFGEGATNLVNLPMASHLEQIWHFPASPFAKELVDSVRRGAVQAGYAHMDIVSGAGHDACYVSRVAPTAMIFVPCKDGISHNEIEDATQQDAAAGCQILLHAMVERADA